MQTPLAAYPSTGREEGHTMFLRKSLDPIVAIQIRLTPVLNVMIKTHHQLIRIIDFLCL